MNAWENSFFHEANVCRNSITSSLVFILWVFWKALCDSKLGFNVLRAL